MSWIDTAIPNSLISKIGACIGASGDIWFVALDGDDGNGGTSWNDAFRTIIYAHSIAQPGDTIIVGPGTFDETANGPNGVVLSKDYIKLVAAAPVHATFITNTNTTDNGSVLTITATGVDVIGIDFLKGEITSNNSIIVKFDGAFGCDCIGTNILIEKSSFTGVKFTGGTSFTTFGSPIVDAMAIGSVTPAIGNVGVEFDDCIQCAICGKVFIGTRITTGVIFNANSDRCAISADTDIASCDVGALLNPGAFGNIIGSRFTNCGQNIIDNSGNATNERYAVSLIVPEAHEDMWPIHLGQGVAANPITITNTATDDTPDSRDDQDYWGDTVAIIAPGAITSRWISNGIELFAGVANKIMRMEFYYPQTGYSTTRNGGNLWDLGETVLTVADGSIPQAGDKVWIKSNSHPNGEIQLVQSVVGNVVTVASETRASGNTGIRYNHAGNETMYVIERSGLNRVDGHQDSYSAASTKASARHMWSVPKDLPPNTAMIGRILNIDDALAASIQVNVVYGD